jgi:hypothetical protein
MKNSAVFTTVQINQRHCPAEISIAVQLELESVSNSTGIRISEPKSVSLDKRYRVDVGFGKCAARRVG